MNQNTKILSEKFRSVTKDADTKTQTKVDSKNVDPRTKGGNVEDKNVEDKNVDPRTKGGNVEDKNVDPRTQKEDNKNVDPRTKKEDNKNVDPRKPNDGNKETTPVTKPDDGSGTVKKEDPKKLEEPISYFKDYTPDKLNCTPWTIDNFFEDNYIPEKRDAAAKRFVIWYVKKVDPKAGGFNIFDWHQPYYKQCGTDPGLQFLNNKDVFRNRVIQNLALTRTNYVTNKSEIDATKDTLIAAWAVKDKKENPNDFLTPEQVQENKLIKNMRKKLTEMKGNNTKKLLFEKLQSIKNTKVVESSKLKRKLYKLNEYFEDGYYGKFFRGLKNLIYEYKKTNLYLTESATNNFESAWNMIFSDSDSEIKQITIKTILNSLKVSERSDLYNELLSSLESMPTIDMFMSPELVSSKITLVIQNRFNTELTTNDEGLEGVVKSVINNTLKNSDNIERIKHRVNQIVIPVLDSAKKSIESIPNEMKLAYNEKINNPQI